MSGPSSQSMPSQRRSLNSSCMKSSSERASSVSSTRRMNRPPDLARSQKIQQRRAGVAQMQKPGGARSEACDERRGGHLRWDSMETPHSIQPEPSASRSAVRHSALLRSRALLSLLVQELCRMCLLMPARPAGSRSTSPSHAQDAPRVRVHTTMGSFVIELDAERAPLTVANFLEYVRAGHYNGTIFHRVIGNFVVQGGGYDEQVRREADARRRPERVGQRPVESSRHGRPRAHRRSAQRQRAVLSQPRRQRARSIRSRAAGATPCSGSIVEGMNVVDDIGAVATGEVGPFERDAPLKPIVIEKVEEPCDQAEPEAAKSS